MATLAAEVKKLTRHRTIEEVVPALELIDETTLPVQLTRLRSVVLYHTLNHIESSSTTEISGDVLALARYLESDQGARLQEHHPKTYGVLEGYLELLTEARREKLRPADVERFLRDHPDDRGDYLTLLSTLIREDSEVSYDTMLTKFEGDKGKLSRLTKALAQGGFIEVGRDSPEDDRILINLTVYPRDFLEQPLVQLGQRLEGVVSDTISKYDRITL